MPATPSITLRNAAPVLDYDPSAKLGPYLCGKQIADVLQALTERFPEALPQEASQRLGEAIQELRRQPARELAESPRSHHRLTRYHKRMPVYTAMYETHVTARHFNLLAPARLLLILGCYDALPVKISVPIDVLAEVCRNWGMHHDNPYAEPIEKRSHPLIAQGDWQGARECLQQFRREAKDQPGYPEQMDKRLGTLCNALSKLTQLTGDSAVTTILTTLKPKRLGNQVFEDPLEPTTATGEDSHAETLVGLDAETEKRIPHATQQQRRILATVGQTLYVTRRWGMVAEQALQPVEAREVLSHLETIIGGSSGHRLIAASNWLLTALTGHRFDALLCAMLAEWPDPELRPHLEIETPNPVSYAIRVPCIRWDRFASIPGSLLPATVHGEFVLSLPGRAVVSRALHEINRLKSTQDVDSLISNILAARDVIRDDVRQHVDRFSELRIRGALAQAVLARRLDLPLAQLLMHDPMGSSCEALHYYGTDQKTLQNLYDTAVCDLYGDRWVAPSNPDPDRLIGAPLAHAAVKHAPAFAQWIKTLPDQPISPQLPKRIQKAAHRHNRLCFQLIWALHIATGHRGNADLDQITRRHISLAARAVLYSDKPADPSGYRRLCIYPNVVASLLHEYLDQLRKLAETLTAHDQNAAAQRTLGALGGDNGLFFRLTASNDDRLVPMNCSIRDIWSQVAPDGMPVNSVRHSLSTYLREQGITGIWVEQQMGHVAELALLGQEGPVSVAEMRQVLEPALDGFMHFCGFAAPSKQKHSTYLSPYHRDISSLWAAHRACLKEDERRLKAQLRIDPEKTKSDPLQTLITRVLSEHVPGYDPRRPPPDTYLETGQIRKLAEVLTRAVSRTSDVRPAIRQLEGRLRFHRHRHGWRLTIPQRLYRPVATPLAITPAALQAYDTLQVLRRDLIRQWRRHGPGDSIAASALTLILWGQITDYSSLKSIVSGIADARWCPEFDCLLIPRADTGESFAVTGLAAAAALHLQARGQNNIGRLQSRIWKALPAAYRGDDQNHSEIVTHLGHLVNLARRVEAPGLLAAAESGELASRQLDMERIRMWASGIARPNAAPFTTLQSPRPRRRPGGNKTPDEPEERAALKRILKVCENPAAFWRRERLSGQAPTGRRTDSVHRAINAWLGQRPDEPPLATIIARWINILTTPGHNRRSGHTLAKSTVKKYSHLAGICLVHSLAGLPLHELDTETAQELLAPTIARRSDPALAAYCVSRLWADLANDYDLPPLAFGDFGLHGSAANIDAGVVTDGEMQLVLDALRQAEADSALPIAQRVRLHECADALYLMRIAGLRRAEVRYLRYRDIRPDRGLAYVRPTHQRGLKSSAAHRVTDCPGDLDPGNAENHISHALRWPTLLSLQTLQFGSALIKQAAGSPATRLHYLRHSKATAQFHDAFRETDPTRRVVALHRLTATLGHSTLSTTLSHYVHIGQLVAGVQYSPPVKSADMKVLADLIGIPADSSRQRFKRARSDVYPNARLLGMRHERSCKSNANRLHLDRILTEPRVDLSVEQVNRWVHGLTRGQPLDDMIRASRITQFQLALLTQTIDRVAHTVGWAPLPLKRMWTQLEPYGIARPDDISTLPVDAPDRQRTVLHTIVEQWRCPTAIHELDTAILDLPSTLLGLSWKHAQPARLPDPSRAEICQAAANAVSAPIKIQFDNILRTTIICIDSSEVQHPPTLRYLIFVMLVIARLRESVFR